MNTKGIALVAGAVLPLTFAVDGSSVLAAAGDPIVIGMAAATLKHPFHAALRDEADRACAQLGARLVVRDAGGAVGQQADDVWYLAQQGVGGIILAPIDRAVVPAIEAAVKSGVPVVTLSEKVGTDKVLLHVGVDNVEVGRTAARFIIDRLGDKGSVIEFEGPPGFSSAVDRKAGFEEVIGKSNVKILASLAGNWSRYRAQALMDEAIRNYPGIDAVFAANDDMIIGAIDAMSAAKVDPASKVTVGVDATLDAYRYMADGKLRATVGQSPGQQTRLALEALVAYIKNQTKPPQPLVLIKPELVTKAP